MGYGTGAVVWIWMSNFHKGYSRLFNGGRLYTRSVFQPCFRFPSRTTIHGEAMSAAANYAWVNRSSMTFLTRQAFAKARGFILRVLSGAIVIISSSLESSLVQVFNQSPEDLDMHVIYASWQQWNWCVSVNHGKSLMVGPFGWLKSLLFEVSSTGRVAVDCCWSDWKQCVSSTCV